MKTSEILNLKDEEIIDMLDNENYYKALEIFKNDSNIADNYRDGAKLSNEVEFITPNEYIEAIAELK